MSAEPPRSGSWWATLPGILTATAAIITAVTGLVAILAQAGAFGQKDKPAIVEKGASAPAPAQASVQSIASGVSSAPIRAVPFTGAVVTLNDGAVIRLRSEIREWCQTAPVLKTVAGQRIEMDRMRRFDLSEWRSGKGNARITLNSGETLDVTIEACEIKGTNDLGDFRADFGTIRSVEFVR